MATRRDERTKATEAMRARARALHQEVAAELEALGHTVKRGVFMFGHTASEPDVTPREVDGIDTHFSVKEMKYAARERGRLHATWGTHGETHQSPEPETKDFDPKKIAKRVSEYVAQKKNAGAAAKIKAVRANEARELAERVRAETGLLVRACEYEGRVWFEGALTPAQAAALAEILKPA